MAFELPPRAMFDVCVPVRRRSGKLTVDGKLTEWSDEQLLPDLAALDGELSPAALLAVVGVRLPASLGHSTMAASARPHTALRNCFSLSMPAVTAAVISSCRLLRSSGLTRGAFGSTQNTNRFATACWNSREKVLNS